MKDKYYQPSIEEFRIGFRYEFLENHGSPDEKWVSKVLEAITDGDDDIYLGNTFKALQGYDRVFSRVACRCKYLCEEDILSLGFVKEETHFIVPQSLYSQECDYRIVKVYYSRYENTTPIVSIDFEYGDNKLQVFRGQVNNINELEVILKQVGI